MEKKNIVQYFSEVERVEEYKGYFFQCRECNNNKHIGNVLWIEEYETDTPKLLLHIL